MVKLQDAVKKETAKVTSIVIVLTVVMALLFWVLKLTLGNTTFLGNFNIFAKINMLNVIIGAACGAGITIINFFLMALTVQKVTSIEDEKEARISYQKSYYRRLGIQLLWMVGAVFIPFVNPVAGILPLLFPSLGIKALGIVGGNKTSEAEVEAAKARAEAEAARAEAEAAKAEAEAAKAETEAAKAETEAAEIAETAAADSDVAENAVSEAQEFEKAE